MEVTAEGGESSTSTSSRKRVRVTLPSPSPPPTLADSEDDNEESQLHWGEARTAAVVAEDSEGEGEDEDEEDSEGEDEDEEDSEGNEEEEDGVEDEDEEESHSGGERSESDGDYVDGEEDEMEEQALGEHSESEGHDVDGEELVDFVELAPVASPLPRASTGSSAELKDVTVADAEVLDCGVCFIPLRPPIFQCQLGHVVCSACRDNLEPTGKCHVCGITTRCYRRCYAMEHLVESILVRCPHAAHGCAAKPVYHDLEDHRRTCPHAPCRCPGDACGFVGSMEALLDHCASTHNWPCTTKVRAGEKFAVRLSDGFNFALVDHTAADDGRAAAAAISPFLFLLNVAPGALGRAISVFRIKPHHATAADAPPSTTTDFELDFSWSPSTHFELDFSWPSDGVPCHRCHLSAEFQVACTDLSKGLPNPEACFQFIVPRSVLGDDKDGIQVKACIIIN